MDRTHGEPMSTAHLDTLYQCLQGALVSNSDTQKQAEAALEEFATRPGCCSRLVEIIQAKDVEEGSRWLASVHLKNIINKSWRMRRDQSGLSASEKEYLRPKLMELLGQEDKQVVAQVNLMFSKVARFDFPNHWPSMLTEIFATMGPNKDAKSVHRAFLVLQTILKELSTKRLPADQKLLAEQWCLDGQVIAEIVQNPSRMASPGDEAISILERWIVLLKAVWRMLMFGIPGDVRTLEVSPRLCQSLPVMVFMTQTLVNHKPQSLDAPFHATLFRGVVKMVKYLCGLQGTHPWAFCKSGVLVPLLQLFSKEITEGRNLGSFTRNGVVMHGATFIWKVLECKAYKGKGTPLSMSDNCQTQEKQLKGLSEAVNPDITNFFESGHAQALVQGIIEKCFKLNVEELQEWSSNPEEFYHHFTTAAQTTETVRGAAEALFKALFKAYREKLCPTIVSALETVSTRCPVGIVPTSAPPGAASICEPVLEKDAVYHAVEITAHDLFDYIDFTNWYNSTLLQEVDNKNPQLWPLRRAAAMVIGAWTHKLKDNDRKLAYQAIVGLLSEQDMCLKLTSIDVLRALIDDWAFRENDFVEYGGQSIETLAKIVEESNELETQLKAFGLVNLIIERMGDEVKYLAGGLVQLLPKVWTTAQGQSLLRMQVLTAYQHLLNAIGPETPKTFPWLLPVIAYSVNIDEQESLMLLEDGLNLWLVTLRNTPDGHGTALLDLFPSLIKVLEHSAGEIWICMQIMSSSIYLGGIPFVSRFSAQIAQRFLELVGNIRDGAYRIIAPAMETLLKIAPAEGAMLLSDTLVKLVKVLLQPIVEGYGMRKGPNTIVFSAVIGVLSRVVLWEPHFLMDLLTRAAAVGQFWTTDGRIVFCTFLDLWMDQFDSIALESSRKLCACALGCLLTLPIPGILERLDALLANMTTVCGEFEGGQSLDPRSDVLGSYGYDFQGTGVPGAEAEGTIVLSENATSEFERKRQIAEKDPVSILKVSTFLKKKVSEAAIIHGEPLTKAFGQLDENLRKTVEALMQS